jgi:DNA-binding transcriptional LysR family regulator
MNLRYLKTFTVVAEFQSFTGAAQRLGLTQSAVSLQIQKLEREFGAQLLDRTRQPVVPTPAGEALLEESKVMLHSFDQAVEAVQAASNEVRGRLALAASTIPGEYLLPRLLARFIREYPAVSVELRVGDTAEVYELLSEGRAAFGFVGSKREDLGLTHRSFAEDKVVLVGPPVRMQAGVAGETPRVDPASSLQVEALVDLPLVFREEGSGTMATVAEKLKAAGVDVARFKPLMVLGSTHAVLEAVRAGTGYGFVSVVAAEDLLDTGELREVPVAGLELCRTIWTVYEQGRIQGALRLAFADFLHRGRGSSERISVRKGGCHG